MVNVDGIIFVYDISNKESLDKLFLTFEEINE